MSLLRHTEMVLKSRVVKVKYLHCPAFQDCFIALVAAHIGLVALLIDVILPAPIARVHFLAIRAFLGLVHGRFVVGGGGSLCCRYRFRLVLGGAFLCFSSAGFSHAVVDRHLGGRRRGLGHCACRNEQGNDQLE